MLTRTAGIEHKEPGEPMCGLSLRLILGIHLLLAAIGITFLLHPSPNLVEARATRETVPGTPLYLPASARQALQSEDKAFPSEKAGFSAYYRLEEDGTPGLDKGKVDDHIFSPVTTVGRPNAC